MPESLSIVAGGAAAVVVLGVGVTALFAETGPAQSPVADPLVVVVPPVIDPEPPAGAPGVGLASPERALGSVTSAGPLAGPTTASAGGAPGRDARDPASPRTSSPRTRGAAEPGPGLRRGGGSTVPTPRSGWGAGRHVGHHDESPSRRALHDGAPHGIPGDGAACPWSWSSGSTVPAADDAAATARPSWWAAGTRWAAERQPARVAPLRAARVPTPRAAPHRAADVPTTWPAAVVPRHPDGGSPRQPGRDAPRHADHAVRATSTPATTPPPAPARADAAPAAHVRADAAPAAHVRDRAAVQPPPPAPGRHRPRTHAGQPSLDGSAPALEPARGDVAHAHPDDRAAASGPRTAPPRTAPTRSRLAQAGPAQAGSAQAAPAPVAPAHVAAPHTGAAHGTRPRTGPAHAGPPNAGPPTAAPEPGGGWAGHRGGPAPAGGTR